MLLVGPRDAGAHGGVSGLVRGLVKSAFIVDLRKFLLIGVSKPENRCWAALLEQLLSL
jgi:hypothetical protein